MRSVDAATWASVLRFSLEALAFNAALAIIGMAAASSRRTVGAGLVTAMLIVVALALMTMLPFDVFAPRLVFVRYFFFPLGEFPNPWPGNLDSPFVRVHTIADFALVVFGTPLLAALPAVFYFARRDVTE